MSPPAAFLQLLLVWFARPTESARPVSWNGHGNGLIEVEAETDAEAEQQLEGPPFFGSKLQVLLSAMNVPNIRECGTRITHRRKVGKGILHALENASQDVFVEVEKVVKSSASQSEGSFWSQFEDGGIDGGQEVLSVGSTEGPFTTIKDAKAAIQSNLQNAEEVEIVFDAGLDMRGCWADTKDQDGRPVCGHEVISDVVKDIAKIEPKMDSVGKSGSTIVTNARGFIIKNIKDEKEYALIAQVAKDFSNSMIDEERVRLGKCHASAITPICAIIAGPGNAQWVFMRKVEAIGSVSKKIEVPGSGQAKVKWLDLKGPKFIGFRDGKTAIDKLSNGKVWVHKDAAFAKMFPNGLHLTGCGAQEMAFAMERDAALLESLKMTDYSLFVQFYEVPVESETYCGCKEPTFPIVVDTTEGIRLSIGIIDYIERKVNSLGLMSTMKSPNKYHKWWIRMWPMYFHLPNYHLDRDGSIRDTNRSAVVDTVKVGDKVIALQKLKWKFQTKDMLKGKTYTYYYGHIPSTSSYKFPTGAVEKIAGGTRGTVMKVDGRAGEMGELDIQFEGHDAMFVVYPWQVINAEKRLEPEPVVVAPEKNSAQRASTWLVFLLFTCFSYVACITELN